MTPRRIIVAPLKCWCRSADFSNQMKLKICRTNSDLIGGCYGSGTGNGGKQNPRRFWTQIFLDEERESSHYAQWQIEELRQSHSCDLSVGGNTWVKRSLPPINRAQQRWESPPNSSLMNKTADREETPRGREQRTRWMVLAACSVGISFLHRA
ncbi:hypothetical protein Bca101_075443 [Brassica carinata]